MTGPVAETTWLNRRRHIHRKKNILPCGFESRKKAFRAWSAEPQSTNHCRYDMICCCTQMSKNKAAAVPSGTILPQTPPRPQFATPSCNKTRSVYSTRDPQTRQPSEICTAAAAQPRQTQISEGPFPCPPSFTAPNKSPNNEQPLTYPARAPSHQTNLSFSSPTCHQCFGTTSNHRASETNQPRPPPPPHSAHDISHQIGRTTTAATNPLPASCHVMKLSTDGQRAVNLIVLADTVTVTVICRLD